MRAGKRLWPLLVLLAVVLVFAPVAGHEFLNYEDNSVLTENRFFRGFAPENLKWMFTTSHGSGYLPLTWLLYAAIHAVQGMNPAGYHLAGLALHAGNALLLYGVGAALLGSAPAAAGAALLFALHPLQVEAAAVAGTLVDPLSILFCLAAVLVYVRAPESGAGRRRGLRTALALQAIGGLSYWRVATLPLALLAVDALRRKRALREKLPFLAVSAAVLLVNAWTKSREFGYSSVGAEPGQMASALLFYPWKLLWPSGLVPLYVFGESTSPVPLSGGESALVLAAVTAALALLARRGRPEPLLAWGLYAASVLPAVAFSAGAIYGHDRHAYLGAAVLSLLAAGASRRRVPPYAAAAVIALLALLGMRQLRMWRDSETLWRTTLARETRLPHPYYRLGSALMEKGREHEAVAWFRLQKRVDPEGGRVNELHARNRLAARLFNAGDLAGARRQLIAALPLDPTPGTRANLALLRRASGTSRTAGSRASAPPR